MRGASWLRGPAQKAEGWGPGVGCALTLQPIPHPAQSRRCQLKSLPFQEEGGEIKVTSPLLLKKGKGDLGSFAAAPVPLLDHAPLRLPARPQARTQFLELRAKTW